MSRLGLGLGLSKGRAFSPFDPLSLNPILAYEASRSMMAPLASESLDLDPANPSSLDVITATRAGTATYTDASGNIQTASPNTVRVDHVQGEELTPTKFQRVKYTDFSSGWGSIGATTQAGNGYLGQPSLIVNAPVLNARTTTSVPTETGVSYTASFYVRYVNGSGLVWMYRQFSGEGITATPITVTSEWTRVQVQFTGGSGSAVNFGVSPKVVGESVEIAMPQVEEGTTASDFVENTTGSPKLIAAATYAPRVPMMLIEPAATNLVRFTDFSSGWTTLGAAPVTSETGEGLAGQPSVILTANANSGRYRQGLSGDVAGVTYTASIWIRRISGSGSIRFEHNSSPTGGSSSPLNITAEWSRVEAQFEGDCFAWGIQIDTSGDSVEIAMPQVEEGTIATSFIPTSGSAVTRAADELVIDGSDFTNFYNQSEGTIYAEAIWKDVSVSGKHQAILFGDNNNMRFLYGYLGKLRAYDGTNIAHVSNSVSASTLFRGVLSYNASNLSVCADGGTVATTTHSGNLSNATQFSIGRHSLGGSSESLNGHIKRLIYWPHHSDNI